MDMPAGYDNWKTTPPETKVYDAEIEVTLIIKKAGAGELRPAVEGDVIPEIERYADVSKAITLMESSEFNFEESRDYGDAVGLIYTQNDTEMSEHDPEYVVRSEMIPPQVQMLCDEIEIDVSGLPQAPDHDDDRYERDFDL